MREKHYKPKRPLPLLPCYNCGGDEQTGHQRLCEICWEIDDSPNWHYFGCINKAGHELWNKNLNSGRGYISKKDFPFNWEILDAGLLPQNKPQEEGRGSLVYINDWTIVSFWDRSVDKRFSSNSAFIVDKKYELQEFIRKAKEVFPSVWERFDFELVIGE